MDKSESPGAPAPQKPRKAIVYWLVAIVIVIFLMALSVFPSWMSDNYVKDARKLMTQRNFAGARVAAQNALKYRHSNPEAVRILAHSYAGDDNAEALSLMRKLVHSKRATRDDRIFFAELTQSVGDAAGAQKIVDGLMAKGGATDPQVLLLAARQAALEGNLKLAYSKAEDALTLKPDFTKALLFKGTLLLKSSSPVERLQGKQALLQASKSKDRQGTAALVSLLTSRNLDLFADERTKLADELADRAGKDLKLELLARQEKILADPSKKDGIVADTVSMLKKSGNDRLTLINWLLAVDDAKKALSLIPDDQVEKERGYYQAKLNALVQLHRMDDVEKLLSEKTKFLSDLEKTQIRIFLYTPREPKSDKVAKLWSQVLVQAKQAKDSDTLVSLAEQATRWGMLARAYHCYQTAAEIGFNGSNAYLLWSRYFLTALSYGGCSKALGVADAMQRKFPDDLETLNNRAYLNLLLDRNVDQSLADAKKLVADKSDDVNYLTTLALAYLRSKNPEQAWSTLNKPDIDWSSQSDSSRAIYCATLAANGKSAEAAAVKKKISTNQILDLERKLIADVH